MILTMRCHTRFSVPAAFVALTLLGAASGQAQFRQEPGKAIGTVTTEGDLIVLTLNEGALGSPNLFDLDHRTLRFTPAASGYRVTTLPLAWDTDFGPEMTGSDATLKRFAFPFSGQRWSAFSVGMTGSITFAGGSGPARPVSPPSAGDRPRGGGGLAVDRFALLQDVASDLINTVPAISVFFKPRMYGTRHLKELADRVVITWNLTEPVGGIQDMTWTPTVNRFQAVLRKDGTIDLSYNDVHAEDAVVGIYPMVTAGKEKTLATISAAANADLAPNLDITSVKLAAVDGLLLKATIGTRGAVPRDGDSAIAGVTYRVCLSSTKPAGECAAGTSGTAVWTVVGAPPRRGSGGAARYVAFGPGVLPGVKVEGNSISVQGTLPAGYRGGQPVFAYAAAQGPGPSAVSATGSAPGGTVGSSASPPVIADQTVPQQVSLTGLVSPAVDLSSAKKRDGPFPVIHEAFHYVRSPRPMDLTCTVIQALGDKFDFLSYYADFRIDNPEAGTPSTGPRGGGPSGGAVTGIGSNQGNPASYCSPGRFQWQYVQPVFVGANQMQEYPPEGLTDSSRRTVVGYTRQLAERTATGKMPPYNYGISQIAHEMGHRWAAFLSARVNGGGVGGRDTIQLGPTHWARGLQAPVAFPYQRPVEASAMGGGVWQDNLDGTFTQLDDDYYVPATGWSYLDLYLMGLIAPSEVPDFFVLTNLAPAGRDPNGHPIVKAERTKITIQDVIAVEGQRLPDVEHAQKNFNTGLVLVVEPGKAPSRELIERVNGIRRQWIEYWTTTTGHRATMTASPAAP
jgi:hypothetical protein